MGALVERVGLGSGGDTEGGERAITNHYRQGSGSGRWASHFTKCLRGSSIVHAPTTAETVYV